MLMTSKIGELNMSKIRLTEKGGRMAARLEEVLLQFWAGFALLTFTVRLGLADDTGRLNLCWDDIPNLILKRAKIQELIRKFQDKYSDLFGCYYFKAELESDDDCDNQFHVHILIEIHPRERRPRWGSIPLPIMKEMAAAWHPFGDLNVRPGAKIKSSVRRVSTYYCKSDDLSEACYRDWGLAYQFVTPSRERSALGILPSAPLVDPRVRRKS